MIESDFCLSRVTDRKQKIVRGIVASNQAIQVIRVINLALHHARNQLDSSLDELLHRENIPFTYRSTITNSSVSPTGRITIPGLFRLLEIISDQVQIISLSVDHDLCDSMPGLNVITSYSIHYTKLYDSGYQCTSPMMEPSLMTILNSAMGMSLILRQAKPARAQP